MSAKTVTAHTPTELRHEGTSNGVAVFSVPNATPSSTIAHTLTQSLPAPRRRQCT